MALFELFVSNGGLVIAISSFGSRCVRVAFCAYRQASAGSGQNIPLMRVVQSVKHTRRTGTGGRSILREGWMTHLTERDATRRRHFWRLDTKTLTMFENETSHKYYKVCRCLLSCSVQPQNQIKSNPILNSGHNLHDALRCRRFC